MYQGQGFINALIATSDLLLFFRQPQNCMHHWIWLTSKFWREAVFERLIEIIRVKLSGWNLSRGCELKASRLNLDRIKRQSLVEFCYFWDFKGKCFSDFMRLRTLSRPNISPWTVLSWPSGFIKVFVDFERNSFSYWIRFLSLL